jgi:hypothetical protein
MIDAFKLFSLSSPNEERAGVRSFDLSRNHAVEFRWVADNAT